MMAGCFWPASRNQFAGLADAQHMQTGQAAPRGSSGKYPTTQPVIVTNQELDGRTRLDAQIVRHPAKKLTMPTAMEIGCDIVTSPTTVASPNQRWPMAIPIRATLRPKRNARFIGSR